MGSQQILMGAAGGGIEAPVGLIIPLASSTVPSGWTAFSSADGRLIVGAGSSYGAGATGGSASASLSGSMSNTGSHTGSNNNNMADRSGAQNSGSSKGESSYPAGAHSHNFSGTASAQDVYKDFRLIKNVSAKKIAANGLLLGVSSLAGLTNTETSTNRFLRANSSYGGTGGSSSLSGSGTAASAGGHIHAYRFYSGPASSVSRSVSAGAHSHNVAFSGTLNTKRIYVSAWTNAASEFDLVAGGIAMWESATPPDGWNICNGANGTPDMRDYFVRIGTTANHGSVSGNNSVSWAASTSNYGSHSHVGPSVGAYQTSGSHNSYSWNHTHNASGSTTVTQPYYALYFIRFAG